MHQTMFFRGRNLCTFGSSHIDVPQRRRTKNTRLHRMNPGLVWLVLSYIHLYTDFVLLLHEKRPDKRSATNLVLCEPRTHVSLARLEPRNCESLCVSYWFLIASCFDHTPQWTSMLFMLDCWDSGCYPLVHVIVIKRGAELNSHKKCDHWR